LHSLRSQFCEYDSSNIILWAIAPGRLA